MIEEAPDDLDVTPEVAQVLLLDGPDEHVRVYRKNARVIARQMAVPFLCHTSQGDIRGEAGDWLVTNHPDDDAGSDVWPVSAERFAATYTVVEPAPAPRNLPPAITPAEIDRRFDYHPPVGGKAEQHDLVRAEAKALAGVLAAALPECREKSLAITALEETLMWSNAAIARS